MKFHQILLRLFATLGIIGLLYGVGWVISNDVRNNTEIKPPYVTWQSSPQNQVVINWETETEKDSVVYYGESPQKLTQIKIDSSLSRIHHVWLNGLNANTTYYYLVGCLNPSPANESTQIREFQTAPADQELSFEFIAISDTQQMGGNGWISRVVGAISDYSPRFLTIVGDLTGSGQNKNNWDDFFESIGPLTSNISIIPVVGNHDASIGENASSYWIREYFPNSISSESFIYSFNYGPVHFTIADLEWGNAEEFTSDQAAWLANDLASAQNMPFRVVLFHSPLRSGAFFGNNSFLQQQVRPILQQHNVSLVLNGHDHHYSHIVDKGLNYVILGGGGAIQDPFVMYLPETQKIAYGPMFSRFIINSTSIQVITEGTQGELIDKFTIKAGGQN